MDIQTKTSYIETLREELVPATGCTEPIAVALCASRMRDVLGGCPEKVFVEVSGNILKNVKGVVVPNTGGMRGIQSAVAAGIIAGDSRADLQVISNVGENQWAEIAAYAKDAEIKVACSRTELKLFISITGYLGKDYATVQIADAHTNFIRIEKNGRVLLNKERKSVKDACPDSGVLCLDGIIEFADSVEIEMIRPIVGPMIRINSAIASEGIRHPWGAAVGRSLSERGGIRAEAMAYAAAGSDARMSGCPLPVVILSGSGNQGITASVPVICYAKHLGSSEEATIRAVALSALTAVHIKAGIGRLSAYCGAVCAGVGAGAAIAYLNGSDPEVIRRTVNNALVILSGMVCDGAKPSCAAKIAMAVDAGILGYELAESGNCFRCGEGIVGDNVETTIKNIGILASEGMDATDWTILDIMTRA